MDSFNVFIAPSTYPTRCGTALRGLVRANCFLPEQWQTRLKKKCPIANSGGAGQVRWRRSYDAANRTVRSDERQIMKATNMMKTCLLSSSLAVALAVGVVWPA